ncbi:unnamed protein product [Rotaria sordida]|uniref:Uncharacterized protein n=1 Tax=Rotaria sordida TaxID=392033 RepID=A0A818WU00_9BILA|nr:unnamed protein product [Rotaria sordida]
MSKRKQSHTYLPMNPSTFINDLWTSHIFLAPNEYAPATIGIHSCLLRCYENEHFGKFFYHGVKMGAQTEDFITQLDDNEKNLSDKSQVDIERCIMIARLREYLKKNKELFQNILNQIQGYLYDFMRENPSVPLPKTDIEFIQQCNEQNQCARTLDQIYRMRRFQYHYDDNIRQSINIINLQTWILSHFQLFYINPHLSIVPDLNKCLENLLSNSFFIIQHPTPSIVTHSPLNKEPVTAKIFCRLLCLLDKEHSAITINDITPYVCRITTSNSIEESPTVYQQSNMNWTTYTIVTALNNQRNFYCADLSEISLRQTSIVSENQKSSKGKAHYSPHIYHIEFRINVTIRFTDGLPSYQHCVIVKSAPFGLVTNTSQTADLFAKVFIQDLKSWKSLTTTILNNNTSSPITTDLTIDDIIYSIRRYFIHTTGIYPKDWVMPYIDRILRAVCSNQCNLIETVGHDLLVKILAQIDYMAEHPVLSLFHHDGICDSDEIDQILLKTRESYKKSICAIRFGSLSRLLNVKDIGVRVDLVEHLFTNVRHYTFDLLKLPFALGVFIIKIILNEAPQYGNILTTLNRNGENVFVNTSEILQFYDSEKLREFCPHKERYPSIWYCSHNEENNKPNDPNVSPASIHSQNSANITTTSNNADNGMPSNYNFSISKHNFISVIYDSYDFGTSTTEQTLFPYYPSTSSLQLDYPQPQIPSASEQLLNESYSNVPEQFATSQINQTCIHQSPMVIVVTDVNHSIISDEDIVKLISNKLPQYDELFQSSFIYRINVDQTLNVSTPISQMISSNSSPFNNSISHSNNINTNE